VIINAKLRNKAVAIAGTKQVIHAKPGTMSLDFPEGMPAISWRN
jgi:hypothetical protein